MQRIKKSFTLIELMIVIAIIGSLSWLLFSFLQKDSDLKKETVLKKGQMVKAIAGHAFFEVSISALAEEPGSIGDVIKLKNMDSLKMFSATIVDRGLVKIE